jgi:hypothetical protein
MRDVPNENCGIQIFDIPLYRTKYQGTIRLNPTRSIGSLAQVTGGPKRLDYRTSSLCLLHHYPTTPYNISTIYSIISYATPTTPIYKASQASTKDDVLSQKLLKIPNIYLVPC